MEKAVLAGFGLRGKDDRAELADSLDELKSLALTAGAQPMESFLQLALRQDSKYIFGKGKIRELADYCGANGIKTIIVDFELTESVQNSITEATGCKVLDRTSLILDIFAKRARTREGKLQVELAELKYRSSHLSGAGVSMMQQTGGIGTRRGPGERKIEMDLRRIRDRIAHINGKIAELCKIRQLRRDKRESVPVPNVGLVGYTNAGKSSLLKFLSGKDTYIDDLLFATLDPLTKAVMLDSGFKVLFTDTVGFIRKLPHLLVEAFRSTLEEILKSDLIIEVVDATKKGYLKDLAVADSVLKELGAGGIERITVYNKIDLLSDNEKRVLKVCRRPDGFLISTVTGEGVELLLAAVENKLKKRLTLYRMKIPYTEYGALGFIRKNGFIKSLKHGNEYVDLEFYIDAKYYDLLKGKAL